MTPINGMIDYASKILSIYKGERDNQCDEETRYAMLSTPEAQRVIRRFVLNRPDEDCDNTVEQDDEGDKIGYKYNYHLQELGKLMKMTEVRDMIRRGIIQWSDNSWEISKDTGNELANLFHYHAKEADKYAKIMRQDRYSDCDFSDTTESTSDGYEADAPSLIDFEDLSIDTQYEDNYIPFIDNDLSDMSEKTTFETTEFLPLNSADTQYNGNYTPFIYTPVDTIDHSSDGVKLKNGDMLFYSNDDAYAYLNKKFGFSF